MNLILFKRGEISEDGKSIQLQDKDPRTKHIFGHLRKVDGDFVTIGIISGGRGKAIVHTKGEDGKRLELVVDDSNGDSSCLASPSDGGSYRHEIVLVLSLPFPKRLKGLWAQITSMGVTRICIIRGALSDPSYCKSSVITPQVYRPLVEEGMSQGCHTQEVDVDVAVDEVVSRDILEKLGLGAEAAAAAASPTTTTTVDTDPSSSSDDARIFLDCGDETMEPLPCRQVILNQLATPGSPTTPTPKRIFVAIGSERGWTDDEAKLFHEAGYESASLGRSILRVDTAVIAGLGIVSATIDEMELKLGELLDKGNPEESPSRKRKQDRMGV